MVFRAGKTPDDPRGIRMSFSSVSSGRQASGVRDLVILVIGAVRWYEQHLGPHSLEGKFALALNHVHQPGVLIIERSGC